MSTIPEANSGIGIQGVGQIHVAVRDVERATGFYRDVLGLRFLFQFPGMAFFDCGGVRLYLAQAEKPEHDQTSTLYYRVSDIREAARELESRGVTFVEAPRLVHQDERHELWLAFFHDTEGNTVALMSEVAK
ncbi:MAG TPA: VOC family protein [Thermoanaerobaculia bacterium]|nr:VOC family protein [Thermoanaerobaculia bacterium]